MLRGILLPSCREILQRVLTGRSYHEKHEERSEKSNANIYQKPCLCMLLFIEWKIIVNFLYKNEVMNTTNCIRKMMNFLVIFDLSYMFYYKNTNLKMFIYVQFFIISFVAF